MSEIGDRLVNELRQSPGRAAVLGVGIVVALAVWGPRVAGAFGGDGPARPAPTGTRVTPTAAPSTDGATAEAASDASPASLVDDPITHS